MTNRFGQLESGSRAAIALAVIVCLSLLAGSVGAPVAGAVGVVAPDTQFTDHTPAAVDDSHRAFTWGEHPRTISSERSDPLIESAVPGLSAQASFAVDLTTGEVLYQENPDERRSPASTLKIVTVLAARAVLDPTEEITILDEDLVDNTVFSNAALQSGDVVTVEDLLAAALIPSGGDAAQALARVAGERLGPSSGQSAMDRFVDEMNAVSAQLGMRNSNFMNPVGDDHPDQYTSARDLAIASYELLDDGMLADFVSQPVYEMTITGPNARSYDVFNTNELLGNARVQGVKTGTTGIAGECLVLLTNREGNRVLTVVMGSDDRYQDTQAILDHIDDQVTWVEFAANSNFPGIASAAERYEFIIATPMVRPVLNGASNRIYTQLYLGPRPETILPIAWGYVVFLHDGEELYRVPVLSAGLLG